MFHVKHWQSDGADGIGRSRGLFVWSGTEDRTCQIDNSRRGGMFHVKQWVRWPNNDRGSWSSLVIRDRGIESESGRP